MSSWFIHVAEYVRISFSKLNNITLYVYATFPYLSIHSWTLKQLPHYSYMNNAAMNMGIQNLSNLDKNYVISIHHLYRLRPNTQNLEQKPRSEKDVIFHFFFLGVQGLACIIFLSLVSLINSRSAKLSMPHNINSVIIKGILPFPIRFLIHR